METKQIIAELLDIKERVDGLLTRLEPPETLAEATVASVSREIPFGAKVSPQFKASVLWIEEQIGLKADHLMPCMAFETGGTFSPTVKNLAGSSGLGLIQFMSFTHAAMVKAFPQLKASAPRHADLAKLTAVQQLGWVYWYFRQFGSDFSHYTLEDCYMTILFPKAVGKPLDWPMPWKYGSLAYKQNAGLDLNKDHVITKAEASAGVRKQLQIGLQFKG